MWRPDDDSTPLEPRGALPNTPCPRAGCPGTLVRRKGRNGPFLGCSEYPYCRETRAAIPSGLDEGSYQALLRLSEVRFRSFLRALSDESRGAVGCVATRLAQEALDGGATPKSLFLREAGRRCCYSLGVKRSSEEAFSIEFGCVAGPTCGDGGGWEVCFGPGPEYEVVSIAGGRTWIA